MLKKSAFMFLIAGFLLAGCSTVSEHYEKNRIVNEPVKLPYNFYLGSFLDLRPTESRNRLVDVLTERQQYDFRETMFVESMVRQINGRSLYAYEEALLRLELKDYAAFKEKMTYTVSFYVDVTALSEKGKVLGTGIFSCLAQRNEALALMDSFKSVFRHSQDAEYKNAQDREVWAELYKDCAKQIAYEFNNKVKQWGRISS